jgi:acid phosphatase type 7
MKSVRIRAVSLLVVLAVAAGLPSVAAAEAPSLVVSLSSDRSGPQALEGERVAGIVYVFVPATDQISRVRFWLDDPDRSGSARQDERNAPWDFAGTAKTGAALPFDTTRVTDGAHVITAEVGKSDGTPQVVDASFTVDNAAGALSVTPASLDLVADVGGAPIERPIQVTAEAESTTVGLVANRTWITVEPGQGSTPLDALVRVDPGGLSAGTHTGRVDIVASGHAAAGVTVTLEVGGGSSSDAILISSSMNRTPSAPLVGQTVKGDIYVFLPDQPGLETVRFWLDDPSLLGTPYRVENSAPYDLAGGTASTAYPLRTENLAEGSHTVSTRLEFADLTSRSVSGDFVVANEGPSLLFSPPREVITISEARPVVHLAPSLSATSGSPSVQVSSDAEWMSVEPCCASVPATLSVTVDPGGLPDGRHTGTVSATAPGYATATYAVELLVAGEPPTQVHLAYVDDPTSSVSVVWRTQEPVASEVEFREPGQATWAVAPGAPRPFTGQGVLHEVNISGLDPGRTYEYRVPGDGTGKSPVYTFRTAPDGPMEFDVVYLADTGIVGRTDGLATGTSDVIQAVAAMKPLVVLPGGDYAYYNTDKRFATLDEAIDAWFRQVEPFAAHAAMMPTYGNHETLLDEGYAPWAARFPTPSGLDNRRNYSFDLGPVHFVSIFAIQNQTGLTSSQMRWLKNDLAVARSPGKQWIVPYMHVSAFADGMNHPSNLALRKQLGPVFEQYEVDVVLMSHDQSYERTWPLVDVPASNRPTSTRTDCVAKNDGVTWVKVSPAGKLSNKNGGFSAWTTTPPPHWTAVRSNSQHHFARLRVTANAGLLLDVLGIHGDGSPPFLVDTVRFAAGAC